MEKRIELEKRGRRESQIIELNLDNCRSTNIVGLTDAFTALESLSLINVGLTTLKGFPKLPNLTKLELSDNRITNGLNYLITSPKLTNLNLSGNKIKDLEALKPLENFKNLENLDLFNNEATDIENYREKIFDMLPSLKYLDGYDANEVEVSSEGDDDEDVINGIESSEDSIQIKQKFHHKCRNSNENYNHEVVRSFNEMTQEQISKKANIPNENSLRRNIENINCDRQKHAYNNHCEEDSFYKQNSIKFCSANDDGASANIDKEIDSNLSRDLQSLTIKRKCCNHIMSSSCYRCEEQNFKSDYYESWQQHNHLAVNDSKIKTLKTEYTETNSRSSDIVLNRYESDSNFSETIRNNSIEDFPPTTTNELVSSKNVETNSRPSTIQLMLTVMAILNIASFLISSGDDDSDVDDSEEETEDEENAEVSLADVYNDDLEEDNSDWVGEEEGEDSDIDEEEGENNEATNQKPTEIPEEQQARGKKRKHDG